MKELLLFFYFCHPEAPFFLQTDAGSLLWHIGSAMQARRPFYCKKRSVRGFYCSPTAALTAIFFYTAAEEKKAAAAFFIAAAFWAAAAFFIAVERSVQ